MAIRGKSACLCALLTLSGTTTAGASTLLISQIRAVGPGGAGDEFVEIYNASLDDVDLTGIKLKYSSSSISNVTFYTFAGGTLHAGCYLLFAGAAYSGASAPDVLYSSTGIADTGSVGLVDASLTVLDGVGFSGAPSMAVYVEGTPLTSLTSDADQGYERKPGRSLGNWSDTNDNNSDFNFVSPTTPRNTASRCVPSDTIFADAFGD